MQRSGTIVQALFTFDIVRDSPSYFPVLLDQSQKLQSRVKNKARNLLRCRGVIRSRTHSAADAEATTGPTNDNEDPIPPSTFKTKATFLRDRLLATAAVAQPVRS